MGTIKRLPEAQPARPGTVQWTRHLWDVLFVLVAILVFAFVNKKMSSDHGCNTLTNEDDALSRKIPLYFYLGV